MPDNASSLTITINGQSVKVTGPITVAAALATTGSLEIRTSRSGQPRGALCGMGICFECRATVDGVAHQRTCQILCRDGIRIDTGAPRVNHDK